MFYGQIQGSLPMFESGAEFVMLESAYDASLVSAHIQEADSIIESTITAYEAVLQEAFQTDASKVELVLEQANDSVGSKVTSALERLKEWITRIVDRAINWIKTMFTSTKKFATEIKQKVEEKKLSAEQMGQISINSYNFAPGVVNINSFGSMLAESMKVSGTAYTADTKKDLDDAAKTSKENKSAGDGYKVELGRKMIKGSIGQAGTWKEFKNAVEKALQGGADKPHKITFSMEYFKIIDEYANNAQQISRSMEDAKNAFAKKIDEIKAMAKSVKKGGSKDDKEFTAGHIGHLNHVRSKIAAIADVFSELMSMKLKTIGRELGSAKAICMMAARYNTGKADGGTKTKAMKESTMFIPLDPLLESVDEYFGEAQSLNESAGGAGGAYDF